jgi:dTMP kinase
VPIVLSDRYLDSSTVYQGIGRNLALGPVNHINHFAVGNVMPDLTILLDVPTAVSLQRIHQRASDLPDRMERENIDFYTKVREGYLLLAKELPQRLQVLDGQMKSAELQGKIWALVKPRLNGALVTKREKKAGLEPKKPKPAKKAKAKKR